MLKRNKIILTVLLIFVMVALSAYTIATYYESKPRNFKITIFLDETEDLQMQMDNVTELIRNYYFSQNMVMSVVSRVQDNESILYNYATEDHLENIVTLLENNGYIVEYIEVFSEKNN